MRVKDCLRGVQPGLRGPAFAFCCRVNLGKNSVRVEGGCEIFFGCGELEYKCGDLGSVLNES